MARYTEPTKRQARGWLDWLASRPDYVRKVAERFEPWSLYLMKSTGQLITIAGFDEDSDRTITARVNVTGEFNQVLFDRQVFGIAPDDLEPCELPTSDAPVGAALTSEEVHDNIDAIRVMVRPDLWQLDENGTAVRKQ